MSFPTAVGPQGFPVCPVKGCRGQSEMMRAMVVHFMQGHVWDNLVILEKGNLPHPWCPWCGIFMPWKALNVQHTTIAQCAMGVQQKVIG